MENLKVLVADDHESFRRILLSYLQSQKGIEVVGEASDGEEAVCKAARLNPDIVLMDIHMPKQNGIQATKEIKHYKPSTKVFILSMDAGEFYNQKTLEFADGFIAKSSLKRDLQSMLSTEQQLVKTPATAVFAA